MMRSLSPNRSGLCALLEKNLAGSSLAVGGDGTYYLAHPDLRYVLQSCESMEGVI